MSKLRVRPFHEAVDEATPRHWYLGSALLTHINNSLCLLLPDAERMVIRNVSRVANQISDPALAAELKAFVGQEAQHARAHERFLGVYDRQGLPYRPLLNATSHILYGGLERALFAVLGARRGATLALSITACVEHYTASWGRIAFAELPAEAGVHQTMKQLLLWHCAEEIEHRHVAFEVLRQVDDSYWLRALGHGLGSATMACVVTGSTAYLLWRDDEVNARRLLRELGVFLGHPDNLVVSGWRSFLRYLRPGFHPAHEPPPVEAAHFLERYDEVLTERKPARPQDAAG